MKELDLAKAESTKDPAAALRHLKSALWSQPTYLEHLTAHKLLQKMKSSPDFNKDLQPVRVAVLGSSTTTQLIPLLELHAIKEGFRAEIYESAFDQYQQEILNPGSELYSFKPQITLLYVNYRDVRPGAPEEEVSRWETLWKTLILRASGTVLMNTFDLPVERPLGNLEAKRTDRGLGRLRRINALMAERAPAGVVFLDQEHLSSVLGKERWHDPRFWHHSRQAMSFHGLIRYAAEAAALIRAIQGRSCKCLAVDLDNTLWGGIVGDDGADSLEIGDTPRGEAFLDFQRYLKALKDRGVLLAACSKNEEAAARESFLKRPEMVLKIEDFAAFAANWNDKAANLRAIAQSLNLGLDALAFVDESPVECDLVRRLCPEISVVLLPEDPADFCRQLDSLRLFETVSLSREDAARTAHFKAEEVRAQMKKAAADIKTFLQDLQMKGSVQPFQEKDVERITQLINKTNQFNLTTRRYAEPEVRSLLKDPDAVTLSLRLADKFGDYGLISVLIAIKSGKEIKIDAWLMSCRVFGRGAEHFMFNALIEAARRLKAAGVMGEYIPTAKNVVVKDFYRGIGFKKTKEGSWHLDLKSAKTIENFIAVEGNVSGHAR